MIQKLFILAIITLFAPYLVQALPAPPPVPAPSPEIANSLTDAVKSYIDDAKNKPAAIDLTPCGVSVFSTNQTAVNVENGKAVVKVETVINPEWTLVFAEQALTPTLTSTVLSVEQDPMQTKWEVKQKQFAYSSLLQKNSNLYSDLLADLVKNKDSACKQLQKLKMDSQEKIIGEFSASVQEVKVKAEKQNNLEVLELLKSYQDSFSKLEDLKGKNLPLATTYRLDTTRKAFSEYLENGKLDFVRAGVKNASAAIANAESPKADVEVTVLTRGTDQQIKDGFRICFIFAEEERFNPKPRCFGPSSTASHKLPPDEYLFWSEDYNDANVKGLKTRWTVDADHPKPVTGVPVPIERNQ